MAKPSEEWKVLPHGKLTAVTGNMWTVEGQIPMPLGVFPRRMTAVRVKDNRLIIFNAISLGERAMAELGSHGKPSFLVVPNNHHRLDAPAWKRRFPAMRVITPSSARAAVERVVPVDTTSADLGDSSVQLMEVPGTGGREFALMADYDGETTLVLNDIVANMRGEKGLGGWIMRRLGFAGEEPRVPGPVRMVLISDKTALRRQFLDWSNLASLKRILVSHGATIDSHPQDALHKLAASLG